MISIKRAKPERFIGGRGLDLRLCRLKDLPVLHPLFSPEIFIRTNGVERKPFSSFLSFCKWITTAFQVVYVIEIGEERGRRIVGFVGLYGLKVGRTLWLSTAIFNPEDRGRGYGQRALELLLNSLQKRGVTEAVYAEVLKTNARSLGFFKKLGFKIHGQCKNSFLLEKNLRDP